MKKAFVSTQVFESGGERSGAVLVEDGVIVGVVSQGAVPSQFETTDFDGLAILPGFIDAHVHVNEPGRTEWEGWETATRAATAGGITLIADMPLNSSPVTTTAEAFRLKQAVSHNKMAVNAVLYAGCVPDKLAELSATIEAGAVGVKAFMIDSGLAEFGAADEATLREGMLIASRYGVPFLAHAEWGNPLPLVSDNRYGEYEASRPQTLEVDAIKLLIRLCRETGAWVHIVHLSAADALPLIREAKGEGLPLTVESAPHYLHFASENVPDDTLFKCAPPIRGEANRERLWEAVLDGTIDLVASDHSPCPPELKYLETADFGRAWGGIAGLQFGPSVTWSGLREKGASLHKLVDLWCLQPARLVGESQRRGQIQAGFVADLVVFDPDAEVVVEAGMIEHKHKRTPYEGERLWGRVVETVIGGVRSTEYGVRGGVLLRGAKRVDRLSEMEDREGREALVRCCGAQAWVAGMLDLMPFRDEIALFEAAERVFETLEREDWLEAFDHHPKIGDLESLRAKYGDRNWSEGEQAGVNEADTAVLTRLAEGNAQYEAMYGYIFIVCASGKGAAEMCEILEARLGNPADEELRIAAGEQMKITGLRLEKLLAEAES